MKYGDVSRLVSALIYTSISDKVLFLRSKIGYIGHISIQILVVVLIRSASMRWF